VEVCVVMGRAGPGRTFMGCHMRKAPPKQALNVASGSVTPCSVPATCADGRTGYACITYVAWNEHPEPLAAPSARSVQGV